jgi:hypothetical protein
MQLDAAMGSTMTERFNVAGANTLEEQTRAERRAQIALLRAREAGSP